MVENNIQDQIDEDWVFENLGIEHVYCGGASNLEIEWIPEGTQFRIDEYDGSETLITSKDLFMDA